MAQSGMYCILCDCIWGKEPCIDCENSNRQCIGKCTCCAEYRKKNIILVNAKRRASNILEDIEDDNNNEYEVNMKHLPIRNGEEFYSTGPGTCSQNPDSEPQSSNSTSACSESLTESGALCQVKQEMMIEVGYFPYIDLELLGLNTEFNGNFGEEINFENSDYVSHYDFWASDSRVSQMRSMEKYEANDPKEGRRERKITNNPSKCDGCACLPGHVSCRACIFWDFTCTYPIGTTRCTCCETFEKLLDDN